MHLNITDEICDFPPEVWMSSNINKTKYYTWDYVPFCPGGQNGDRSILGIHECEITGSMLLVSCIFLLCSFNCAKIVNTYFYKWTILNCYVLIFIKKLSYYLSNKTNHINIIFSWKGPFITLQYDNNRCIIICWEFSSHNISIAHTYSRTALKK